MNNLPDPSFFLQLSESFIKTAKLETTGEKPRLTAIREISSAELASQPNPIIQVAGEEPELPISVATTLSLGETVIESHQFDQIGFSTLTEFIGNQDTGDLFRYELGVFMRGDGMPAPTASPSPLELVFCGFNSQAIPELSDAFPNLDATPTSITLGALDLLKLIKSQSADDQETLLVEIGNEKTHLLLIDHSGLAGVTTIDLGRQALYEAMAEVLHLHYLGSAIKLFTRSGFDSSELAPKLGEIFGSAIQSKLKDEAWSPSSVHIAGLLHAQEWFREAVLNHLELNAFRYDRTLLPFEIDSSVPQMNVADTEIVAKVAATLTLDEDFAWHNEYLPSLRKAQTIPRRKPSGSNPPFPSAHPERLSTASAAPVYAEEPEAVIAQPEPQPTYSLPIEPETVVVPEPSLQASPQTPPATSAQPKPAEKRDSPSADVGAIPQHLLNDIEEYEGEFEDLDDYGGGGGRMAIKLGLLVFSVLIVVGMVMIVFFPKASEKYLGIRPPHIEFEDGDPSQKDGPPLASDFDDLASIVEMTDADVERGVQDLRQERENVSFGGLYLPTDPPGATVVIGELSPRVSPIKLPNVVPGDYDVIISKDGYETVTMSVSIEPKEVKKIETVILRRLP